MKILVIASEVVPFAKTGGLADVASALPKALAALGHDVRIVMPRYRQVLRGGHALRACGVRMTVPAGARAHDVAVWEATLPKSRVITYFLECDPLFDRDGLYQGAGGSDHPDNLERFSVLSQAALQLAPRLRWRPDVIHSHDWQSALALAHVSQGAASREATVAQAARVLTVHNLAYQGLFGREQWPLTGLPDSLFTMEGLEFYGQVNCLKGGVVSAHMVTTVSPTYAREIQTPEWGCGLDGVLRARREELVGILNGIDPEEWNPDSDPHLPARYHAERLAGKAVCKQSLQRTQGLPERPDLLIGMVQRLVEQKGMDLLLDALEELMALPLQLVLLGAGDPAYQERLMAFAKNYPGRLAVTIGFNEALAHQIEAGADAFLMPSRFEPCGLNQMYSMRYGTVPIVKHVGGLADTVSDITPATLAAGSATGFVLSDHTSRALLDAVKRALAAFGDRALWSVLIRNGMRQDFSWQRAARAYEQVYEHALQHPVARIS